MYFGLLSATTTLVTASVNTTCDSATATASIDLVLDVRGRLNRISTWIGSQVSSLGGTIKSFVLVDSFQATNMKVEVAEQVPSSLDETAKDQEADDDTSSLRAEDTHTPNIQESLPVCPLKATKHVDLPIAVYHRAGFHINTHITISMKHLCILVGSVLLVSTLGIILYLFFKIQSLTLTLELERKAHKLEIELRDQQALNASIQAENAILKEQVKVEREKTKTALMKEKQACKIAQEKHKQMARALAEKVNMNIIYNKKLQDLKAELEVAEMGTYCNDNGWPS